MVASAAIAAANESFALAVDQVVAFMAMAAEDVGVAAAEAASKFARKWARQTHGPQKHEIVAFSGGFHGRTMGAVAATWKAAYREPFAPLVPGVRFAPFNDLALPAIEVAPVSTSAP